MRAISAIHITAALLLLSILCAGTDLAGLVGGNTFSFLLSPLSQINSASVEILGIYSSGTCGCWKALFTVDKWIFDL